MDPSMVVDTSDASVEDDLAAPGARSGVLALFSGVAAVTIPFPFVRGGLTLGRAELPDARVSREHAEIQVSGDRWTVRDLRSRNGTFVDGAQIHGAVSVPRPRVIRIGDTLLVPFDDVSRLVPLHEGRADDEAGGQPMIVGAALRSALGAIDRAARSSATLLIRGESGAGKELAARRYHAAGPHLKGRFIAVNCATIPEGLAERLLFGTKRGAYSGATVDAVGHLEMADGGVLFLDEAGELDLEVQAKLLRVLETREIVPLGASIGRRVELCVCMATHRDLRKLVAEGRFRADLYHRIAPPEVVLPPLRARVDEIPRHVLAEIARAAPGLAPHVKLIETCLLRAWPGNVRELRKEIFHATVSAREERADRVRVDHLGASAGQPIEAEPSGDGVRKYVRWSETVTRDKIAEVLDATKGNVATAAKQLGMRRTQLYREMERYAIERPKTSSPKTPC
jgi:transcriptional regulator with GAF, ATPase, and Fis domain